MKKIYKLLAILPVLGLAVMPVLGFTQVNPNPDTPPIESLSEVETLLGNLLTLANTIFWILAAFFILFAAFKYLTAQGDEDKIKKAKNMLVFAVIAITIALFAGGVDTLINNILNYGG